jgi:hypothetical protein
MSDRNWDCDAHAASLLEESAPYSEEAPAAPIVPAVCASDPVTAPAHYCVGGYERIKVAQALGLHEYGFLWDAFKYLWRCLHKGNTEQDIEKCIQCLQFELERRRANKHQ